MLNQLDKSIDVPDAFPEHARLGCVGDGEISGISIKVDGIADVDLKAVEDDFFAHVDAEESKESAVRQLLH